MNFMTKFSCAKKIFNLNIKFIKIINFLKILNNHRPYTSALYVPGSKANQELAYLKPDLNFDPNLDIQKFQKEIKLRGYNFDLEKLYESWKSYLIFSSNKNKLEAKQRQYTNKIKILTENNSEDKQTIDNLYSQCKIVKECIQSIRNTLWNIEETIIPQLLKLPNEIDERTPEKMPVLLKNIGTKPNIQEFNKQNHLNIGKSLDLIDFKSLFQYFLINEAAYFELAILSLSSKILNNSNFERIIASDFCRSLVIEGSGIDHEDPFKTFIIQESNENEKELINRLHLVGNASLPSLLALYTKKIANEKDFPIKVFNTGKQYTPIKNNCMNYGLFSVSQASVVQTLIFVKEKNSEIYEIELQNLIKIASEIYDALGHHYRVIIKPIKELGVSESMRISFEMWSVYLNRYIEVGYISLCGEYFSKRLLFGYENNKNIKYPSAITGMLISVPKVLACILEENPKAFILSKQIKEFLY